MIPPERNVMRSATFLIVLVSLFTQTLPVQAGDCRIDGPLPKLDSQPIEWTFAIAGGQRCLRGLRSGAMLLDSVVIASPAKFGEATTQGYSFSYKAPQEFKGEDAFSVVMSGKNRGVRGSSTIRVRVLVQ